MNALLAALLTGMAVLTFHKHPLISCYCSAGAVFFGLWHIESVFRKKP